VYFIPFFFVIDRIGLRYSAVFTAVRLCQAHFTAVLPKMAYKAPKTNYLRVSTLILSLQLLSHVFYSIFVVDRIAMRCTAVFRHTGVRLSTSPPLRLITSGEVGEPASPAVFTLCREDSLSSIEGASGAAVRSVN